MQWCGRGHGRIFPKSYAKAGRIDLLPFNRVRQPNYTTKISQCFQSEASCCAIVRLRNAQISQHYSLSVGFWEAYAMITLSYTSS